MAEALGEFSHRHVGNSFSPLADGGLSVNSTWEGTATGFGNVFGSLIFEVADGATDGKVQWLGQAFPPDSEFVNGTGDGTWSKIEGAHRWRITLPALVLSTGNVLRCEGEVDLESRTFSGQMYSAG